MTAGYCARYRHRHPNTVRFKRKAETHLHINPIQNWRTSFQSNIKMNWIFMLNFSHWLKFWWLVQISLLPMESIMKSWTKIWSKKEIWMRWNIWGGYFCTLRQNPRFWGNTVYLFMIPKQKTRALLLHRNLVRIQDKVKHTAPPPQKTPLFTESDSYTERIDSPSVK